MSSITGIVVGTTYKIIKHTKKIAIANKKLLYVVGI